MNEDAILTTLRQQGQMTAMQLAGTLDIADSTARRNLAKLEEAGVVRRLMICDTPKTFGWAAVEPRNEREKEPGNPAADDLDELVSEAFESPSDKAARERGIDPDQLPQNRMVSDELDAMRAVYKLLEQQPSGARHRIIRWVCEKLELDVTF